LKSTKAIHGLSATNITAAEISAQSGPFVMRGFMEFAHAVRMPPDETTTPPLLTSIWPGLSGPCSQRRVVATVEFRDVSAQLRISAARYRDKLASHKTTRSLRCVGIIDLRLFHALPQLPDLHSAELGGAMQKDHLRRTSGPPLANKSAVNRLN
jgi:hypothetical protein